MNAMLPNWEYGRCRISDRTYAFTLSLSKMIILSPKHDKVVSIRYLPRRHDGSFAIISNLCWIRLFCCHFHAKKQMTSPTAIISPPIIPPDKLFSLGVASGISESDVLYVKKSIPIGPAADTLMTLISSVC